MVEKELQNYPRASDPYVTTQLRSRSEQDARERDKRLEESKYALNNGKSGGSQRQRAHTHTLAVANGVAGIALVEEEHSRARSVTWVSDALSADDAEGANPAADAEEIAALSTEVAVPHTTRELQASSLARLRADYWPSQRIGTPPPPRVLSIQDLPLALLVRYGRCARRL